MTPPTLGCRRKSNGRAARASVFLAAVFACGCDFNIPLLVWHEEGKHTIVVPALSAKVRNEDGSSVEWYTPLYHKTRDPKGGTVSWHLGPYARGPGYKVLFPLYFEGVSYWFTPLGPFGRMEHPDGGSSVLATPFYYHRRDAQGRVAARKVLPFYTRAGNESLIPILLTGWRKEEGRIKSWYSVPILSGGWTEPDGSCSTWLTPLVHWDRDASGCVTRWHALNAYGFEGLEGKHYGLFPVWAYGPGYCVFPPLLSGLWTRADGSTNAWITPLIHRDNDPLGASWHVLTAYGFEGLEGMHHGVFPLWASGPNYLAFPFLLSGRWLGTGKARSVWITPFYHHKYNESGKLTYWHLLPFAGRWAGPGKAEVVGVLPPLYMHGRDAAGDLSWRVAGPFFWSRDAWTLFPLVWWRRTPDGGSELTVAPLYQKKWDSEGGLVSEMFYPLYYRTPEFSINLPLLGGRVTRPDGSRILGSLLGPTLFVERADGSSVFWCTPLYHHARDAEGKIVSWSIGPVAKGENYKAFFPFYWQVRSGEGVHRGCPLYMQGPNYRFIPPVLGGALTVSDGTRIQYCVPALYCRRLRPDGSSDVWWTLYHHRRDAEGRLVGSRFLPFYAWGPDYWALPILLSYSRETFAGGRETMLLGPLYYNRTRADRSSSTWALWPFYHHERDSAGKVVERYVLPFYMRGEGYRLYPIALSGRWTSYDGSDQVWVTPFYHHRRDGSGKLVERYVLPFYMRGEGYRFSPIALSGRWTSYDGSKHTWVTPLWHWTREKNGKLRDWHFLTFGGREGGWAAFPFACGWRRGWAVPPLLAGSWTDFRRSSHTWVTPLFHRTVDRDGKLQHDHFFIFARWGEHQWAFPLYGRGPGYEVWPLFLSGSWKLRGGGRLALCLPLLSGKRTYADGSESLFVSPLLLWARRKAPGLPADFQILGGILFGRKCDYEKGTYRYYFLGGIPWGRTRHFGKRARGRIRERRAGSRAKRR